VADRRRIFKGSLPVAALADGRIELGDYRDWRHAVHMVKSLGYDREIFDGLLESIPQDGVMEPLTLGVSTRYGVVYLSDGHHRAVALWTLKIPQFPYRWFVEPRRSIIRMTFEKDPMPEEILEVLSHG
jgi:hypothetical protein